MISGLTTKSFGSIPLYGVPEVEPEPNNSIIDMLIQIGSIIVIPIVLIIGIIVFIKKKKSRRDSNENKM